MACLLSMPWGFSTLPSPKTLAEELPTHKVDKRKLPSPAASITVMEVIAPKCWGGGVFATRSCHHHITIQSRCYCELVSCYYNVSNALSPVVLSGFWVGPDIDDGWGFVEAFVTQIF